jgi:O-antigen/teichoic acid export membrane protein
MAATLVTAGVGLIYWAVAAKAYNTATVGSALSEVSTITLVSVLCQMNLTNIFPRFLPQAGAQTRKFVIGGYTVSVTLSAIAASGFAYSPYGQKFLVHTEFTRPIFVVSVVAFTVFTVQDAVMTGMRHTQWVPLENAGTAMGRVVLLFAFAGFPAGQGLVFAWLVPTVIAIVAVQWFLMGDAIPAVMHNRLATGLPSRREFLGHAAGEYAIGIVANIVPLVLPLIVVAKLGASANALFYLPWLMNSALNLLISNITTSLVVEASTYKSRAQVLLRRAARMAFAVAITGSIGEWLFAPFLLGFLGKSYGSTGASVSHVLALAVPINVINVLFAGICRIDHKTGYLVVSQSVTGLGMVGGAWFLAPTMGVHGVALGYFFAQVVPALVLTPYVAARLLIKGRHRAGARGGQIRPAGPVGLEMAGRPVSAPASASRVYVPMRGRHST